MPGRVVVVGGDAGGMAAAAQARRLDPSLEIVAFEKGTRTSYAACGIPYVVGGEVEGGTDRLVVRTPQQFRDDLRIDVRIRHEVMAIDLDAGRVEVRNHEHNRTLNLGFDVLHLATGARPLRPELPGIDLPFVHGVQTLDDADALLARARTEGVRRVVVVGGGYIGIEMAEAFVRRGLPVTMVEKGPHVLKVLDPDMAGRVESSIRSFGVELRTGVGAAAFEEGAVHLDDGSRLPADLVVLGLGVQPNVELAAEAGIALGATGAIAVDRRQRTSHDAVYAAGDCAESTHLVSGRKVHVALGTVANRQGKVAGTNIGGGYATYPGLVGTAITKLCGTEVSRTGLNEREAAEAGFEVVTATIESTTRAGYLPGAEPLAVKLLAERGTGRLLGGQIVGGQGAAKRIDVVAVALHAGLEAHDLVDADLAYAPPFGPLWDPIAVAARVLLRDL